MKKSLQISLIILVSNCFAGFDVKNIFNDQAGEQLATWICSEGHYVHYTNKKCPKCGDERRRG